MTRPHTGRSAAMTGITCALALFLLAGERAVTTAAGAFGRSGRHPALGQGPQTGGAALPASGEYRQVVDQYCVGCHNDRTLTAGLSLEGLDLARAAADNDVWERVIKKLGARSMPPAGMPRPDDATLDGLVTWLESSLDRAAEARPNPGQSALHRLNRAEYANAIRDLLDLKIDAAALLPPDELSGGFDNMAAALGVSPVLIERYLNAAENISAVAVGDPSLPPSGVTYATRADSHQLDHVEGLPLGTRGGLLVRRTFPLDAEYDISATLYRSNSSFIRGLSAQHGVVFTIDGEPAFTTTVGGEEDWGRLLANPAFSDEMDARLRARVFVEAGTHDLGVTFVAKTAARNPTIFKPLRAPVDTVDTDGVPRIDSVQVMGPFNATGSGDTASRRRIFTCRPEDPAVERTCATAIVTTLAERAFRRPVGAVELEHLLGYFERAREEHGTFDAGVQFALRRILMDPAFLFRMEHTPDDVAPGTAYPVSDLELASRLSFFLWSSIPDDELRKVAVEGRLREGDTYAEQVQRMLDDSRSAALVENFAGQWLQLRNLQASSPDLMVYPEFDDGLRQGFRRETELLFESILREGRSVLELLTADYTFVNERLARHYGIPGVTGSRFRRVAVPDEARRGLLGHGSMLLVTSHPNRTSPVKRGKWVLENLMGSPPPPPPPNVPPLDETQDPARPLTMKERMEDHRRNPVCANCHRLMDPIGLALENFDGVGTWRVRDTGVRIDTSTQLADGAAVDGAVGLRQALLRRPKAFVRTVTENLLAYALGRALTADDMPAVRTIMRQAEGEDYSLKALTDGVTRSLPFLMRMSEPEEATVAAR